MSSIIRFTDGDDGVFAHVTAPSGTRYGVNLECLAADADDAEADLIGLFFRAVVDCVKEGATSQQSMDFGGAIRALKRGERVAREGWNGKGMWLLKIQGSNDIAKLHGYGFGELLGEPAFADTVILRTPSNRLVAWTASQEDMLAEDWTIVS